MASCVNTFFISARGAEDNLCKSLFLYATCCLVMDKLVDWNEHKSTLREKITKDNLLNVEWRLQNLYPIFPKRGPAIPFKLNKFQKRIFKRICENRYKQKPIVILKARQLGITTFFCLYFLDLVMNYSNCYCVIIADCDKNLENIFRITRLSFENKFPLKGLWPPEDQKYTRYTRSIIENKRLNSYIEINLEVRAKNVNFVHYSELAFMDHELFQRTKSSYLPGTFEAMESTAKGINHFHDIYFKQKHLGNSFFFGTQEQEEYSLPLPVGTKELTDLTPDEKELKANHNLTDEQILFRREKLDGGMLPLDYKAHYPYDDTEPFLLSGNQMIDGALLAKLKSECDKIIPLEDFIFGNMRIKVFEKYTKKDFEKFKKEKIMFSCGIDPAQGVGNDYSVAVVLKINTLNGTARVVMTMRGYANESELAEIVHKYLTLYFVKTLNDYPMVVIEQNQGHVVLDRFSNRSSAQFWPPGRIYWMWRVRTKQKDPGFLTTSRSREIIIKNISDLIRQENIKLSDSEIVSELMTFVYKMSDTGHTGRYEAEQGKHDDLILALCFAWEGYAQKWRPATDE